MNVLITGCLGFIGLNFTKLIAEKYKNISIIGLDSANNQYSKNNSEIISKLDNCTLIIEDITNIEKLNLENKKFDAIFHFAAESHVDNSIYSPDSFIHSNILGTSKVLQFSIKNNIKNFYHVSTDEVYGSNTIGFNKEVDPINPSSPYSASKASAELICSSYVNTYEYQVCILRPANNYGIYQQPEKLIPFSIANLMNKKNIEIYGNGKNIRHWLHVDDTSNAILHLFENQINSGIFNIGSNEYLSNIELAHKLISILNLSSERIEFVKDRPGHDFRYAVEIKKLEATGWKPLKNMDNALEDIVKWYELNSEWWRLGFEEIQNKRARRLGI